MSQDPSAEPDLPWPGNIPPAAHDDYDEPPPRRWPWIVGGLVLLAAGTVAALPFLISSSWLNGEIRGWLRENVATPVDFKTLEISWSKGLRLSGLEVRDAADSKEPLLYAPLVEIDVAYLPLVTKTLDVRKFVFHDPVVRIARTRDGRVTTEDVVKTKKVKKEGGDGTEEVLVLPEIRVPIVVDNLTLVFEDGEGHRVERAGITFDGRLTTRDGPTTFRLHVPDGTSGITLDGEATLFDPVGALLPEDRMEVRSKLVLDAIDAADNRDVLALLLGDAPASGRLDGRVDMTSRGGDVQGSLELTLRGVAVGDAVGTRPADAEDLRISGRFEKQGDTLRFDALRMVGPGLEAHADVSGAYPALGGEAAFSADLGTAAGALRALGLPVPEGIDGQGAGSLRFDAGTKRVEGGAQFTGLSLPPAVDGGAPVAVEKAEAALVADLSQDSVALRSLRLALPEASLSAEGRFGFDGAIDVTARPDGDVGALVARARDLGFAPRDLALAGRIGGEIVAHRSPTDEGVAIEVRDLALRADGVVVTARGTVAADGALDLVASGEGELEKLLAAGGASAAAGRDVSALKGRFSFEATANGPPARLRAELRRLRIDGDLQVDAAGRMDPDGALEARVDVSGAIGDAVRLARSLGVVEGEVPLDGRLALHVEAGGSTSRPEVPRATFKISDGPLAVDLMGSLDAAGRISGSLGVDADVDALLGVASAQGLVGTVPTTGGRLVVSAILGGTREAPEVPTLVTTLSGVGDVRVEGSLDAQQTASLRVQMSGTLQRIGEIAAAFTGGEAPHVEGDYEGLVTVEGALRRPQVSVPRFAVRSAGLTANAKATLRPDGTGQSTVEVRGPLEGLLNVLRAAGIAVPYAGSGSLDIGVEAQLTGGESDRSVVGSVTATVRDLVLANADAPGATFREPSVQFALPALRWDMANGRPVNAVTAKLTTGSGLRATVGAQPGADLADLNVDAQLQGPAQPLASAAALFTGGAAAQVPGNVEVTAHVSGRTDAPEIEVRKLRLVSDTLAITGDGARISADRRIDATITVKGAIAGLVAIAKSAGAAADLDATGTLDATLRAHSESAEVVVAAVDVLATDLAILSPPVGSGTFHEPRLSLVAKSIPVVLATGEVRPFDAVLRMAGCDVDARIAVAPGKAAAEGAVAPLQVSADGRLAVAAEFVGNHPELFPDTRLERAEGPFRFAGDVSQGMDGASGWTGGFDLVVTNLVAPYVDAPRVAAKGVLQDGVFVVDPLTAEINGGTANGTARIGLVGEKPEHRVELHAAGVQLRGDLAPLLSRASPLLAVGDSGRAGGTTGLDVVLTAKGLSADVLKRSVDGQGTLALDNVFAESGGWIGTVLELVGGTGNRLDVTSAKVPFQVRRGRVTTEEVGMSGGVLDMLLGGTVGLDGALDYAFKVRPKQRGGTFDKYAQLLDKDGFLPLRLEGGIASPSLKLPSLSDAVKSGLGGLLDGLKDKLGGEKDGGGKKKKDKTDGTSTDDPPPPPPPAGTDPAKATDEPGDDTTDPDDPEGKKKGGRKGGKKKKDRDGDG